MRKAIYGFLIVMMGLCAGCEKLILAGEGELLTITEEYETFSKLSFYDIYDVKLRSDSVFSVTLQVYEKYRDRIEMRLDSGNISFYDRNPERWLPEYPWPVVVISFPRLDDQLFIDSPVWISTPDTLRVPSLKVLSLGKTGEFKMTLETDFFSFVTGSDNAGYYIFSGKADDVRLWPRGSSQVNAAGLVTHNCNVYNNSIGDCSVNVTGRLEARLNTAGNIIYYGDPAEIVLTEESGEGRLMKGKH